MHEEIAPTRVSIQATAHQKRVPVKRIGQRVTIFISLIIVTLVVLIPLLWMLTTSL